MLKIKSAGTKYYRLLGVFILILILTKIDVPKMVAIFTKFNIFNFLGVSLLIIPCLFFKSHRWRYLLSLQGIDYSIKDSFLSYLGGVFAGLITPMKVGETIKIVYLKEDKNIPFSQGLTSVFFDRLLDVYLVVILGIIGMWWFLPIRHNPSFTSLLSTLFFVTAPLILFNKYLFNKLMKIIYGMPFLKKYKDKLRQKFDTFISSFEKLLVAQIYIALIITVVSYIPFYVQGYLLSTMLGLKISFLKIVFFISVVKLASTIPITLLGIGTREASLLYLFAIEGLSAESAIAYSLLIFLSFYIFAGFITFIGWFLKGGSKKVPKHLVVTNF